jgi:hypothetical protein
MAALDRVPDELLSEILASTGRDSIVALALTSRRLNQFVTPILYRFVEYIDTLLDVVPFQKCGSWQKQGQWERYGLPRSLEAYRHPSKRSRIFRPSQLLRTIQNSPNLASLVSSLSFDCKTYEKRDLRETVISILDLLNSTISYLHIC